ncbi:hypothetical protein Tco_1188420 [Tanacetum coccineum]
MDVSADTVSIPKKEIIKEALGILGLVDDNDLSTSSKDRINKSPMKVKSKNLKPFLAHQITTLSFGTPPENVVPMTSHMYNVVSLPRPDESLISSTSPHSGPLFNQKRYSKKQPSDTQHTEDSKVLADIPSIDASESAEELGNQPQTTDTTRLLVDTTMGDDEPITKKVQETSNDDKTKADFSDLESMPDDEFMDFTKDAGIAESEEETGNIHASAEQPSQTTTRLTPIPFPSMQNVQELWAKEIWKRQYNKPTYSVPINKEVVSTITSLSTEVRDLGDIIGTSVLTVNDKFEELNKVESQRFVILENALKSSLKSTIKSSVKSQLDKVVDLFKCSFGHNLQLLGKTSKDMTKLVELVTRFVALINPIPAPTKGNIEREKEQKTEETPAPAPTPAKTTNEVPTESNAPIQGEPEETGPAKNLTMVVHKDSDLKESDPEAKKPKVTFEMLTPIQSVMPPAFTNIPFS